MSALSDVARLAGVSKATASRALSGHGYVSADARRRVADAAEAIGYIVSPNAASLVTGRTKNIGVVVPFLNRWFFAEVLEGIERALLAAGYDMTVYNLTPDSPERERIFDFFLARKRFDGVIVIGIEPSEDETVGLIRLGKPVIGVGPAVHGIPSIGIDDVEAGALATRHLLDLGHRDILHIGGEGADESYATVHGKRLEGFRLALAAEGLSGDFRETSMTMTGGHAAAMSALTDPSQRPSAIFAACDEIAIGVIVAARELGITVPGELSVIGIDGYADSAMFGLTTLEQDPQTQGRVTAEHLIRALDGGEPSESVTVLPIRLIERTSTAPPL